jgi:hypothetical protein
VIKEVNGSKAKIVLHTNAKAVTIDLQARLVGVDATCKLLQQHVQLATCSVATCSACSIQPANCHVCRRRRHQLPALAW